MQQWDLDYLSTKYTKYQVDKLRNHQPIAATCKHCNSLFDAQSYIFRPTAIYPIIVETCSRRCTAKYGGTKNKKITKEHNCKNCSKAFTPHKGKPHQVFCSTECRVNYQTGKPRPEVQRWIDRITPPKNSISKAGTAWLDSLNVPLREYWIETTAGKVRVDGFDPATNTVYEYLGSFWHGNPNVYNHADTNPVTKQLFGVLHDRTQTRLQTIIDSGYNVIYQWSKR